MRIGLKHFTSCPGNKKYGDTLSAQMPRDTVSESSDEPTSVLTLSPLLVMR